MLWILHSEKDWNSIILFCKKVRLIDYKVRVLDTKAGTGSKVRVLIEASDGKNSWLTVGVSENIISASFEALIDSFEYKLHKDKYSVN